METLSYDSCQFEGRVGRFPIEAHAGRDGWTSTGIDFSDYARMHSEFRAIAPQRRLAVPEWALDDRLLRELLVVHLEARGDSYYWHKTRPSGTLAERLAKATHKLQAQTVEKAARLEALCKRYVSLKNSGQADPARLRELEVCIENIDTDIRVSGPRLAEIVVGATYRYYRVGQDSVAVAQALGLKSPHLRMLFWRLARCWARMQASK